MQCLPINVDCQGQRRKGSAGRRHYLRTLRVQCLPVNAEPHGQRRKGSALRHYLRTTLLRECRAPWPETQGFCIAALPAYSTCAMFTRHCGTTCVLYVNAEPHGQRRKGSALRHYLRTLRVQRLPVPVNAEPHGQRRKGSALRRLLRTLRVLCARDATGSALTALCPLCGLYAQCPTINDMSTTLAHLVLSCHEV